MGSKRSGYSIMYMIPPSVWELVKKCVDEYELKRLEELNKDTSIKPAMSRGEQILSNISSQDIVPLDKSYRSRSDIDILETDLSQPILPQEVSDEIYYDNPSFHHSDRSRSILNPNQTTQSVDLTQSDAPLYMANMTTQTVDPTQMDITRFASDMTTQTVDPTEIDAPLYMANMTTQTVDPTLPITPYRVSNLKRSASVPIPTKYNIRNRNPNLRSTSLTDPADLSRRMMQSKSQSQRSIISRTPYSRIPPPNISRGDRSLHDTSRISFDPRMTSTPLRRLPTIPEDSTLQNIIPVRQLSACNETRSPIKTRSLTGATRKTPYSSNNLQCHICNKTFARKYILDKHILTMHRSVSEPKLDFDRWKI